MYGEFFIIFTLMFTGYGLRKIKLIDEGFNRGLNKLIMYFIFPCLLLYKVGTMEIVSVAKDFSLMLILSAAALLLYSVIGHLYTRQSRFGSKQKTVAEMSVTASNNGYMGFPVALLFLGERGLLLMMAHNTAMNIYTFAYGVVRLQCDNMKENKDESVDRGMILKSVVKAIFNPNISAFIAGCVIALLGIPLDNLIGNYLNIVGSTCTPLSMIYIGSTLAEGSMTKSLKNSIVWETSVLKLVVLPALTLGICMLLPIEPVMKSTLLLGAALPTAAMVTMVSDLYHHDREFASRTLFVTTVFSMATIPLFMWLAGLCF